MCGIFGIVSSESLREPPALLEGLTDSLGHRGPDGRGSFVDEGVFLGHRRLSIIDVKGGLQPMSSCAGRYVLVYNGEVYNFECLRRTLEELGHRFRTRGDTEVVLRAYAEWGESCLDRFNGMFAFAIWDTQERQLFLARDRLGIKPLYYTWLGPRLLFASEMKAIVGHPEFTREADLGSLSTYLSLRTTVGESTFFAGLKALVPGHRLLWRDGSVETCEYWDLPHSGAREDRGEDFYVGRSQELLHRAVSRRLVSDVPVGAYLSGGLDSSLVVALMSEMSSEQVNTFSIGFGVPGYDEGGYAHEVSDHCGTRHRHLTLAPDAYVGTMEKLIRQRDEPLSIPHEAALYRLSVELKKEVGVCLSGEGADELFGGYGRVLRSPMDYKKLAVFKRLPGLLQAVLSAFVHDPDLVARLGLENDWQHLLHVYHWWDTAGKRDLFTTEARAAVQGDRQLHTYLARLFEAAGDRDPYERVFYFFERVHLLNLLRRLDMQSMAASVEARVPFVDHELVEFVSAVPVRYKLRWRSPFHMLAGVFTRSANASERLDIPKYLLRRLAGRRLPPGIVWRPKLGFPVPLDAWFRGSLRDYAREVLFDRRSRDRGLFNLAAVERQLAGRDRAAYDFDGKRIWMLLNVELWFREFIDQRPQSAVALST